MQTQGQLRGERASGHRAHRRRRLEANRRQMRGRTSRGECWVRKGRSEAERGAEESRPRAEM